MHELSLMESLVEAVQERVGAARVLTVRLEVGRLSCVAPDALRFCFDVCARGTGLEGAVLDIVEIPARARCRDCDLEAPMDGAIPLCRCGSADVQVTRGRELRVKELEVL